MPGESLQVTKTLAIPYDELEWRFTASGGPGGQHANTANTKVEVRFSVSDSPALSDAQRERLLAQLGPVVRVVAHDERSQSRNRELALARLAGRLAGALRVRPARRPTRPSRAAKERRVAEKRRQGDRKRDRATGHRPADD